MEIPLLRGRDIGGSDTPGSPAVAVVNETFVRKFYGDKDPLGQAFRVDEGAAAPESIYQIVGVVKDTKYTNLREDLTPIAYVARSQDKKPDTDVAVLIRSDLPPDSLTSAVEHAVAAVSPAILIQFTLLQTQIRDTVQRERLMATLSGFFGALAALLATIGLYGVMSYTVAKRRNEIGIRMALGAARRDVLTMVMREAGGLLIAGIVIGALLAIVAARAAATLLFGLRAGDPATLAMAAGGLGLVGMLASYLPALRASRLEPTEALREE